MLLVGYFENIASQRGIAWRCADSLSLRKVLGVPLGEETPDHSSITRIRKRLLAEVFREVFRFVLQIAEQQQLLSGKRVGVDRTTLEANAAMTSIVHRDTGEDWQEYLTRLMREEGLVAEDEQPSDEALRRFDKGRKKKLSNDEWQSTTDPDSHRTRMIRRPHAPGLLGRARGRFKNRHRAGGGDSPSRSWRFADDGR